MNNNDSEEEYLKRRRSQLTDMTKGNANEYWDFYEKYYHAMTGRSITSQSTVKNELSDLKDMLNNEIKGIEGTNQEFKEYTNEVTGESKFTQKKVEEARKLSPGGSASNPELDQYMNDTRPYLDTSSFLTNVKNFTPEDYEKEMNDLKNRLSDNVEVNANVFDWKSLDPLQDNIGSVKSLVEFFFNFMMCYPAPLIKGREEFANATNIPGGAEGFYLPLPDEWIKDGGILDKMMDTTTDQYKLLKYRGIPIHIQQGIQDAEDYIKAYIPTRSVGNPGVAGGQLVKIWDVTATTPAQNRTITSPYITQPLYFDDTAGNNGNGGSLGNQRWDTYKDVLKMGGYFRGFLLNTTQTVAGGVAQDGLVPNHCSAIDYDSLTNATRGDDINNIAEGKGNVLGGGGAAGLLGYGTVNSGENNITQYIGGPNTGYNEDGESNSMPGNNNVHLSVYFSNVYRTLYDIVYSNPAFITDQKQLGKYKNDASQWFAFGIKGSTVYDGNLSSTGPPEPINEVVGGYVNINGSLPGTQHRILGGAASWPTLNQNLGGGQSAISSILSIPGYHASPASVALLIAANPGVNGIGDVAHFRATNTARTAYNTILLQKSINPDVRKGYIDASSDDSLKHKYITDRIMGMNIADATWKNLPNLTTNNEGNSILDNRFNGTSDDARQNLWFANPGGYLGGNAWHAPQGSEGATPTGLLTARYNTSDNADGDLTKDFPLADSIPNDDVIEAVVYKFAKMIFNNLKPDYLIDNTNNNVLDNAIKYFSYRLSRSIIVVKDSIFTAPICHEYDDSIVATYRDAPNKYLGGDYSAKDQPGRLYDGKITRFDPKAGLQERQTSATYCENSQPLTISLTTMFREAFTKMMNKAILTRHFNRDLNKKYFTYEEVASVVDKAKKDGNKTYGELSSDKLVEDSRYIAGCAGQCKVLVKLDVSDILTMKDKDSDFYYMEYLRNCLNTDKNINKYNFTFDDDETFRPCSAGVIQTKTGNEFLNYTGVKDIGKYLYDTIYLSKLSFLDRLESIDSDLAKNRKARLDIVRRTTIAQVKPIIQQIINAIENNQPYKVNAAIATLISRVRGDVNDYKVAYDKFNDENERLNAQLLKLNEILESGKDIDYSRLESRVSALYDRKQKNLNDFEEKYDKIVPRIVVTISEMRKTQQDIVNSPSPRLSKPQKEALSEKIGDIVDRLSRIAEVEIPGLVSDLLDRTDMDKLINLDAYMEYILKDPQLNGGVWVPLEARTKLVIKNYKIFNIFTGEIVELKSDTDLKQKNIKGKILISTKKDDSNWYYYNSVPDPAKLTGSHDSKMEYLQMYRKGLFESYGQPGRFDVIRRDFVKRVLYTKGINKNLSTIKEMDVKTFATNCKDNRRDCVGFIYFNELVAKLLNIVKEEGSKVAPKELYEKVSKAKNVPLKGTSVAATGGSKKSPRRYSKVIIL